METSLGVVVIVLVLAVMVIAQWIIIWRLLNRLLIQARVPSLGPVLSSPPEPRKQAPKPERQPIMRVKLDPFAEE